MATHADVIVLGTGGVGSAAVFHLARRGVQVIGLDRFPGGHDRGSSHGHTRIIRLAYFEHPDYVPLLRCAFARWADLETLQNERLFFDVGLLEVGRPDGPTIRGILDAARMHHLDVERFTPSECRARFPGFVVPEDHVAIFEAQAGYLLVERCVLAHLDQAARHGASLRTGETVHEWSATRTGVTVTTDRDCYHADRLILTAGPWAPRLLADVSVPLTVRRKHVHWFPAGPAYRSTCPTFLFETADGEFYGFPDVAGRGVKVGEHSGGTTIVDPLTDDHQPEAEDGRRVEAFLAAHLPGVGRPVREHGVCYYTMSPDGHFLVDRHPMHANVCFAAGLSGHGFKFTCVLGEALADLAVDGATSLPVAFLGLSRFAV